MGKKRTSTDLALDFFFFFVFFFVKKKKKKKKNRRGPIMIPCGLGDPTNTTT